MQITHLRGTNEPTNTHTHTHESIIITELGPRSWTKLNCTTNRTHSEVSHANNGSMSLTLSGLLFVVISSSLLCSFVRCQLPVGSQSVNSSTRIIIIIIILSALNLALASKQLKQRLQRRRRRRRRMQKRRNRMQANSLRPMKAKHIKHADVERVVV